jgi:hypothetical protein
LLIRLRHARQWVECEEKFVGLFVVEVDDQDRDFHLWRCGFSQVTIYQTDFAVRQDAANKRIGIANFRQETFERGSLLRRVDAPIPPVGHKL